jgi:hypothetical protein
MKARHPRADFVLSPEVREAAVACGKLSDVAASHAMRGATRRLIRAEQYRVAMQQKARLFNEAAAAPQSSSPRERQDASSPWPVRDGTSAPRNPGDDEMDMTKFAGDQFLKVEDVRASGPVRVTIEDIRSGQYDKPVASLSDGSALQLKYRTHARSLGRGARIRKIGSVVRSSWRSIRSSSRAN